MSEFKKTLFILATGHKMVYICKHRPDKEKPNWHYYEKLDGEFIHFRKEHMVMVEDLKGNI